uniref:Pol polyprotein putative n=1 Tax=Albugo laibachii Nc14 TaxID=890382 RepID=F0WL64_9STRA|nr:pol polyprotein putative [Albugo laibachii Nc14]|eukprot:CCA22025.1 pol polyprotein putative [Albugo laibachii Nc14]
MEFDVGNGAAASEGDDTMTSSPEFSAEQVAHNKKKKTWQRSRHVTRSTTRAPVTDGQQKEIAQEMGNHIVERVPLNYGEAMKSSKALEWTRAMDEEISALLRLGVFEVIKRPRDSKALHSKWVFKTKNDAEGRAERFKARLVACENEQKFGVDFLLTFAAVMDMSTVKVVLALAVIWGVPAQHGDVPNAYAQADKESGLDIFLHVPSGMKSTVHEIQKFGAKNACEVVLRLKKTLYSLKQVGRLWSQLLHENISEAGFERCITDMCLYYRDIDENIMVVGVYVDDLLVTSTRANLIQEFFRSLSSLSIKQLGAVRKLLGMRFNSIESGGYVLDHEEAIDEILRDAGMDLVKTVRTPIGDDCYEETLGNEDLLPVHASEGQPTFKSFQSLVGSLLWVARSTRPNIAFSVHEASRQTHQPSFRDWNLAKRSVRYLYGSKTLKLHMVTEPNTVAPLNLATFSDADFASDRADR